MWGLEFTFRLKWYFQVDCVNVFKKFRRALDYRFKIRFVNNNEELNQTKTAENKQSKIIYVNQNS